MPPREEHPIWRPNSFTSDEWNKLSREEQIRWWKAQDSEHEEPRERPSQHPLRAIEMYQDGIIAKAELPTFVFERLTPDNATEFVAECPSEFVVQLQERVNDLPGDDDDEGWSSLISIRGVLYAPWVTEEEIRAAEDEQDKRFRSGVRVFRNAVQRRFRKPPA